MIIPPVSQRQPKMQTEPDTACLGLISFSVDACIGKNCEAVILIAWTITPQLET